MMMLTSVYCDPRWALTHGNVCTDSPHHLYTHKLNTDQRAGSCVYRCGGGGGGGGISSNSAHKRLCWPFFLIFVEYWGWRNFHPAANLLRSCGGQVRPGFIQRRLSQCVLFEKHSAMLNAAAAFSAARQSVIGNPGMAKRVSKAKLPIYFVILLRWNETFTFAQENGVPWPLQRCLDNDGGNCTVADTLEAAFAEFSQVFSLFQLNQEAERRQHRSGMFSTAGLPDTGVRCG